jgi:hypothetical protein
MDLVKVDAKEYGIEETKAKQIAEQFKPMLDEMAALEKEYNDIVKMEMSEGKVEMARALRLKYVTVRTGTAKIHTKQKSFYLAAGRYIDGWKNAQVFASQDIEGNLTGIENHFQNIEKERLEKLKEARMVEIRKYFKEGEYSGVGVNLGEMTDDVWDNYIAGTKLNYETKLKAEKEAEAARLEDLRLNTLTNERVGLVAPYTAYTMPKDVINYREASDKEFNDYKSLLISRKGLDDKQREDQRLENERLKKEAEEKAIAEKAEKEKADKKLEDERKAKEAAELKLKEKEDADKKAEADRIAALENDLKKADKIKVGDLMTDLNALKGKYEFKSKKNKDMYGQVGGLIDKVVNFIGEKNPK